MTKGKRQKARNKRATAPKQQQGGNQPLPTSGNLPPLGGQEKPAVPASAATTGNQQAEGQDKREGPSRADLVDWQRRSYRIEISQAIFSALLVVTAIVTAAAGIYQWEATRDQYDVMVQQNKIMLGQQRPWIKLVAEVIGEPEVDEAWPILFVFENSGQAMGQITQLSFDVAYFRPGKRLQGIGHITETIAPADSSHLRRQDGTKIDSPGTVKVITDDDARRFNVILDKEYFEHLERKCTVLNDKEFVQPNEKGHVTTAKAEVLTESLVNDIKTGNVVPFVVAMLTYDDASGQSRTSRFVGKYNYKTGKLDEDGRLSYLED